MEAKADSLQSPCLALTKELRAFGRGIESSFLNTGTQLFITLCVVN